VTSRLLAPWRRPLTVSRREAVDGGREATPILDWEDLRVLDLIAEIRTAGAVDERDLLIAAHRLVAARVRPVYGMDDRQPVSVTLALGRGSCSQRMAVLEAVARACGIETRVRGLLVDGRFWYPRFPRMHALIPHRVVLAWPEFRLGGRWISASGLYGDLAALQTGEGFTNAGGETLFDAIARTAVDWDGVTCSACDLSAQVLADLGYFDSRDELFEAHGQTLCRPARTIANPIMSRRSA
jgi:hypothetical protein